MKIRVGIVFCSVLLAGCSSISLREPQVNAGASVVPAPARVELPAAPAGVAVVPNGFSGVVPPSPGEAGKPGGLLVVGAVPGEAKPGFDPWVLNYTWIYHDRMTFSHYLDNWAYGFGYRFESTLRPEDDPVVSDGTFVGSVYGAMVDLASFAGEGYGSGGWYGNVWHLRTKTLQVCVLKNEKLVRVERRHPEIERLEALEDRHVLLREEDRLAKELASSCFYDRGRSLAADQRMPGRWFENR